ncbi:MAG TPA: fibronectin type III domain-containing protein [Bacteroidales bacterium]|nr:fibronectin type III domain-containing protein [Bacteroidales bacterium]HPD23860.1 fibronectin type III domain-containing protein [Bacteroidales bacterium]HRS98784.1 fibronectin type III domain-containing protein [Bacteroidales bacterium]HRT79372.1 fibronectin type III domain-containing protein [Bacteroidales bacterium]
MKNKVTSFLKEIFLLSTVFAFINLNAQTVSNGDFEYWTGSNPDGWTCVANFGTNINFAQASGQGVTGDALSVIANSYNPGADGYISTTVNDITPGNWYDLAVMLKANDDLIKIRMTNLKWKDASDAVISTVTENTLSPNTLGNWIEFKNPQNPLQAPANAVKLEVNIVFYFNVGINPGVSEMLIDNFTVVDKTNAVAALQHAASNTLLNNSPATIVATYQDDIYFSTTIQYPTFLPELPLDVLNDIKIESNIPINAGTVINIKNTAFSIDYYYNVSSPTTSFWITEMLGISRPTLASFSNQTQVWEFTLSGLNGGDYVLTISSVADDNYNTPANYYILGTDNVTLDIATPEEVAIQDGIDNTNMTVLPTTQTINSTETATITSTTTIAEFLPDFPNDLLWDVLISFPGAQLPAGTQMSIELNSVAFATYTFVGGEQELWLTLLDDPNTLDRSPILALSNTIQTITVNLQNIPTENSYTIKLDFIAATATNFNNPANYYYFATGQANVVVDNTIYATFPLFEGFEGTQFYFENAPGNQVNWVVNSTIFKEGTKSFHNPYGASNNNILKIIGPLNINNVDNPVLSFWHIAKTENNFDHCYVEVSTDGTTWTIFPIEAYLGQGNYVTPLYNTPEGRCFMTTSYTDWGTTNVPAQNTWWKKEKFSLTNYKSGTTYVRFRLKSDGSIMYNGWYIDDINIYNETCPDPSGFAAINPLISQVTLNWNPIGTTSNWQIKYSTTSGFDPETQGILIDDTGMPPYTLTGLAPSTTYYVYIRTKCDGDEFSPWIGPINFTTLVPCPNPTAFAASNITANSAELSWTQIDGATEWTIIYGPQGFNPSIEGTILNGITENPYTITGLIPETQYQAYIRANCGANGNSSLVGPISFTTLATCPVPTSLAFVSATGTTATINWNPVGGTTQWNIQYGPTGFTLGTGTIISGITSLPYTITGLNPTTAYQVYVQADCGSEQSVWSSALSFTTDCNEITPPWLENFSGTFPPSCWLRRQGQLTVNSTLTTSTLWIADGFANVGTTGAARINIYGTNRFAWFITPTIDLGDGSNNYMLEFDLALTAYNSTNPPSQSGVDDKFAVVISTDNGATWSSNNILKLWDNQGSPNVYNNISNTGQHVVIDLSSYTGFVKIGFYGESTISNADNDLFIDNVAVTEIPECPNPSSITASNPTINSVDLNWTEVFVGTEWDIIYGAPGFNPETQGTLIENIITNPYTVTGLTPGTAYHFYVRRNCSSSVSEWVGPATSITEPTCPIPTALSASSTTAYETTLNWTENGSATEWDIIYGITGFDPYTSGTLVTGISTQPYTLSGLIPGTNYQAYVRANCGGGDLSPWSTAVSFTTGCGVFPIIFSQNFSGTFPPLCWDRASGQLANPSVLTTPSTLWVADGFANVGATGAAKINIYSTNKFGWLFTPQIDLGNISEPKLLEFDLALTASSSTNPPSQSGVDDKFAVVISTDGGTTWTSTNVLRMWDNQGSPYVYNNISNTGEHVFIDLTGYSGIVKFGFYGESTISNADNDLFVDNVIVRPLPSCFEPLSVNSGLVTSNSTQISWTELIAGSEWEIVIGTPGFDPNSQGTIISNITTNPYTITGLSPETQYSVYVRTVCGAETSTWTGPTNFTTYPSCVAPININATAPSGTSITISWTEVGTASQWDLIYGTPGFNPNNEGTLISGVSSTTYTITGLAPLTDYTVYLRSDCGMSNYSSWSTALNFNTGCSSAFVLPVSESFETGLGIFKNAAGNNVLWETTNTVASMGTFSAKNPYGATNTNILVTQCPVDLSTAVNPVLQFSNMALTENNYDHCYVEYSTNGSTWTILPVSAYLGTGNYTTPLYNSPEGPAFTESAYAGWASATPSNTLWKSEKFSLSSVAGQSEVWIRFRLKSDGYIQRQGWHIDKIQILDETCPEPTNLNASGITANSATLSWTQAGGISEWDIVYGPSGFDPNTEGTLITGLNTNPYTFTGLTPLTTYNVYVRANCGGGNTSIWSSVLIITTGCEGSLSIPLTEDFESGFSLFKNATGNTVNWITTNTVASSGTFSAKNPYGATNTNILVTQCPVDLSTVVNPVLQFSNMALTENNYDHCYVEYSTNGTTWTILPVSAYLGTGNYTTPSYNSPEGPAFTEGAYAGWSSATPSNTLWKTEKFSLAEIAGQSEVWIRFRLKSDGSIQRQGWHIDKIQIYNETCPAPSNINIITNSGFQTTIGWNENGTATVWEVLYGPAGFDPQTQGISEIVNTTQYQITGLTPTTNYQVYVRALCGIGDESIWTGPFSWSTTDACPPVQGTSLVIANYESLTIQINTTGDETEWDVVYGLQGFIYGEGTQINVNTNPFTISGLNVETAYDIYVRANCGVNGTSTWVGPFTYSTTELCPPVSNVQTLSSTPSSVVIGWNPGYSETEWTIEYGLAGFVQGTGTLLNLTSNQVELTGLQGNTNYTIYIMANCGGIFGDSDWVQYNFKTPCNVIDVFPWVEEFDNWIAITDCWDLTSGTQTVSQYLGNAVRANFWSWSSGNTAYMTSPDFDISSLTNPRLEFKWSHLYNASYPNDKIEVFVSDNGGLSWTSVWMKTGEQLNSNDGASTTTPGTYVSSGEIYLDAFADNIKFRIIFTSGYGPDAFIDNITIYDFICEDPSDLSVSNITHNSAQLSWTDNSGAGWVNIYYGPQGFDPQTEGNVLMNINQNPFTLTGLDAATAYDFYVESLCGTVFSAIIGPVSFTTSDCPEPQNIVVSEITPTSATITWTDNSGGNHVNIYFGTTGFDPLSEGDIIQNVNPSSYTITGLTADTQYDVYIETICGLSTSTLTGPYSFTTLAYNNETDILTFTFGALDVNPATIIPSAKTVYIVVQNGTDLTNLVASFTLSQGATAYVNGVPQVSGVTANNFTNPVIYNIVAENGTDNANWTVTVDVASEISINESAGIKIYPNPNKGNFIINFTSLDGNVIYQIFDSKSAIITEKSLKDVKNTVEEVKVDVNPGVYHIRIITDDRIFIEKIVIE